MYKHVPHTANMPPTNDSIRQNNMTALKCSTLLVVCLYRSVLCRWHQTSLDIFSISYALILLFHAFAGRNWKPIRMALNYQSEEEVKEYLDNIAIEYRFGCYSEKNPEGELTDFYSPMFQHKNQLMRHFIIHKWDFRHAKSIVTTIVLLVVLVEIRLNWSSFIYVL